MTIVSIVVIIVLLCVVATTLGCVAIEERDDARKRLIETQSALYDERRAHGLASLALHRQITRQLLSVDRGALRVVPPCTVVM